MGVSSCRARFYSHVNYSVTKIIDDFSSFDNEFYSHVNYSVTKIPVASRISNWGFYSHVNYSVTKIYDKLSVDVQVLQSRKLFSY